LSEQFLISSGHVKPFFDSALKLGLITEGNHRKHSPAQRTGTFAQEFVPVWMLTENYLVPKEKVLAARTKRTEQTSSLTKTRTEAQRTR
jgi:hypothetical protein